MAPVDLSAHNQNANQSSKYRDAFINIVKPCLLTFALITALGLSTWTLVSVKKDVWNWEESKDFEDSVKDEMKVLGKRSEARIILLAHDIKEFKVGYVSKLEELKLEFNSKMVKLNQDLLNMQGNVSVVQTDVDRIRRSLEKIRNTFDNEHFKVWAEFTRIENEIKNLKGET